MPARRKRRIVSDTNISLFSNGQTIACTEKIDYYKTAIRNGYTLMKPEETYLSAYADCGMFPPCFYILKVLFSTDRELFQEKALLLANASV